MAPMLVRIALAASLSFATATAARVAGPSAFAKAPADRQALRPSSPQALTFTDVTARAGISFVHHNGAAGNKWYPELFGGGVAVLDIDGDAWPDLLFVNGKDWQPGGRRARHALYLNNRD